MSEEQHEGPERPMSLLERMRGDWDRRAREDHKLHIATGHSGSEEAFLASGRQDLEEVILDGIALDPAARVLEIGCGVGRLLLPLSERVAYAAGVDIAPTMVEKGREYAAGRANVAFSVTDGTLGEPDGSLDFVYSFIVFQHIPDKAPIRTYLNEAARVLAPGGVFRFQVDGRWRERFGRAADTYEGVVFAPEEIRRAVAEAGLTLEEEWGAETHYHRLTCAKPGGSPRARLFASAWDEPSVRALLRSTGAPEEAAPELAAARLTFRDALGGLLVRQGASDNEGFVREMYRTLLRREPDAGGLAFHRGILDAGFEDRPALVDTIVMGSEFRAIARPYTEPTWVVREALAVRGVPDARTAPTTALADELARRLAAVPPADAVRAAFDLAAARPPDANDTFAYGPVLAEDPEAARRALALRLLGRGTLPPKPPAAETRARLLERCGVAAPAYALARGESFAGEGAAARAVLESRREAQAADFLEQAYALVLGRPADAGGAAYYAGKLERGEMSRPELVRELLWSGELRGA